MEKWKMVRSFQEYKELLGKWRELYHHNNGLYPSEIQHYIKKEKCFYRQFHWGILLLFDEDAYYQGAVYLKKNWQGSLDGERLSVPGDVLCNLVGKEEDENRQRLGKHLLSMGFSCILRNREYRIAPRTGEPLSQQDCRGIRICRGQPEHLPEIIRLWKRSLPRYVLGNIDKEQCQAILMNGRLLVALTEQNEICGASYYDLILGQSTEHHVTVDEQYRGRGIGKLLVEGWLRAAGEEGASGCCCWVEEKNQASVRLHGYFGAEPTGKVSEQFLLRKEGEKESHGE